ncbi:Gamma-butyrobetaine dioxygenase, partial [Armadillidium vulgare]
MARRLLPSVINILQPKSIIRQKPIYFPVREKASSVSEALQANPQPKITSVLPAPHATAKVIFDNHQTADFKYIWLRDNCRCSKCIDANTKQKLVDTPSIDVNLKPKSLIINSEGQLESFIHNNFGTDAIDMEHLPMRPELKLWNRAEVWANFPELSYNEFMESEEGLRTWLEMFYQFGVAVLRGVPVKSKEVTEVVKRFAYVKETQYGQFFDVINKPQKEAHLAFTGLPLAHHTDMNYREKSPGMQLLHCLKATNYRETGKDPGGRSFFADGFRVAKWMEDNEPSAFHVLTSTPVRFSIKHDGMRYSALWQVICLDAEGDVSEIHYNNRTMQPLQAPVHVVTPFYHAYKMFSQKLREPSNSLEFQMLPGDLVAFNNRRIELKDSWTSI